MAKCEVLTYPWFAETHIATIYSIDCVEHLAVVKPVS